MALGLLAKGLMGAGKAVSGVKMAKNIFKRKGGKDAPDVPASEQIVDVQAETVQPITPLVPTINPIDATGISKATSPTGTEDLVGTAFRIKTTLVDVDTLLRGSFALDKIREQERIKKEKKEGKKKQEKELESAAKKNKRKFGLGRLLPTKAKSIFGNIINFFVTLLLGKLLMSLLNNVEAFEKVALSIAAVGNFIVDWGGKFFDTFVSFIDFGYNMVNGLRNKVGDMFGERGMKIFDQLSNVFKVFLNTALIAAMIGFNIARGLHRGRGRGGGRGRGRFFDERKGRRRGFNRNNSRTTRTFQKRGNRYGLGIGQTRISRPGDLGRGELVGRTLNIGRKPNFFRDYGETWTAAARRYAKRFGRKAAEEKFGKEAVKILGEPVLRSSVTKFGRKALTTTLGKGGTKQMLKFFKNTVSPIVKRIPLVGALVDFLLNVFVFKEPLGRSAFMAIGAGLGAWIGGAIGTLIPIPFVGTSIGVFLGGMGGDMLGGAIYDFIFSGKEPKPSKKVNKKKEKKKKEEFKGNRGFLGWRSSADFFTGNRFDFDNQSGIKENINTTRYEGLDTETSYEQEGTTTYVISQTGSSDGDETSSGTNAEVTQMSEGLILSGSGSESNNSYDVLAKR